MGISEINRSRIVKLESRLDDLSATPPTSVFNNIEATSSLILRSGNNINSFSKISAFNSPSRSALLIRAKNDTTDGAGINLYANDDASFPGQFYISTGGYTRFQILQNGKIGIGTANPNVALDVIGDISASGTVNSSIMRAVSSQDVSYTSTNHGFQIGDSTNANIRMDIDEILAVNNGLPSALFLNSGGGTVKIGDGLQSRADLGLEVWGGLTVHGQSMSGLSLTGHDHTYIEFYSKLGSGNSSRTGFFGFATALNNDMVIGNELFNGGINFVPNGTGAVTISDHDVWHKGMTASGRSTISSTASATTTAVISFGKTFPVAPNVVVTADVSTPDVVRLSVLNVTSTGFTIANYRTNTATTAFYWIAMLPS